MPSNSSIYDANMPKITPGVYGQTEIKFDENRDCYTLEHRGISWMYTDTSFLHPKDTLYSQYDLAYGDVLITGLGFGIIVKAISEKPEVTSVTVVELQQEVIDAFLLSNTPNAKVKIIQGDASTYESDRKYDCFLPDHYEHQSISWILNDMNSVSKKVKHDVFLPWSIERIFLQKTYPAEIYTSEEKTKLIHDLESFITKDPEVLHTDWVSFINEYLEGNRFLLSISASKLFVYVEKHAKYYYQLDNGKNY